MSSAERRLTILRAAARLFEHYGHGKTTMADVAREAHVGVGTVYLEFDSKDAIVEELSLGTQLGVIADMRAAATKERDHGERLVAVFLTRTQCFLAMRKKGQHACELLHCRDNDVVKKTRDRFHADELALVTQIIEEGRSVGRFRRLDAPKVAALIQRALATLSPPWLPDDDAEAMRTTSELMRLLLGGMLADRPRSNAKKA
jgi:AcrR family transcriptional regulator